ncbi:MAG TPA: DUF1360 domain-containing protein [Intrasporangium sp.]|nr:DUF1360 domain-containing protein [Intrasporangium sp.]
MTHQHQHVGIVRAYAGDEDRPLPGYLALMSTYALAASGLVAAARKRDASGADLPDWSDLARGGIATYRLSRLLTKASITSALRAPLVRYQGKGRPGEVIEEVAPEAKEHTTTHALAELITCPFCLGQWIGTVIVTGHLIAPRVTRVATGILVVAAASDALQLAHAALERAAKGGERQDVPGNRSSQRG